MYEHINNASLKHFAADLCHPYTNTSAVINRTDDFFAWEEEELRRRVCFQYATLIRSSSTRPRLACLALHILRLSH